MKIKPLEKLGISPEPWEVQITTTCVLPVDIKNGNGVHFASLNSSHADASLFVAAPKMYDALYKVYKYLGLDKDIHIGALGDVIVKALSEASGEGGKK